MSSTLAPPLVGQAGPTEYGGGRRSRVAVLLVALVVGTVVAVAFGAVLLAIGWQLWRREPVRVDDYVVAV